jgi:hypothetical protein
MNTLHRKNAPRRTAMNIDSILDKEISELTENEVDYLIELTENSCGR